MAVVKKEVLIKVLKDAKEEVYNCNYCWVVSDTIKKVLDNTIDNINCNNSLKIEEDHVYAVLFDEIESIISSTDFNLSNLLINLYSIMENKTDNLESDVMQTMYDIIIDIINFSIED